MKRLIAVLLVLLCGFIAAITKLPSEKEKEESKPAPKEEKKADKLPKVIEKIDNLPLPQPQPAPKVDIPKKIEPLIVREGHVIK